MRVPEIRTARLRLRGWRGSDRAQLAQMNADPEVMRFFPAPLTAEESDALADRIAAKWARHRLFGWWAAELPGEAPFIGFVGLNVPDFDAPFTPCVEVGWRLDRPFWGRGFATEAARACLEHGFRRLWLPEIVSFTAVPNTRSAAVMERIGMRRDRAGDFDHPALQPDDPLRPHLLYRMKREEFTP